MSVHLSVPAFASTFRNIIGNTYYLWFPNFQGHLLNFKVIQAKKLSETDGIWGFWAFSGECMGGIAWNLACWCILITFRMYKIFVTVCWSFSFWQHFDKFGVSRHFLENAWEEWPEIWYAEEFWSPSELIKFFCRSLLLLLILVSLTVKQVKFDFLGISCRTHRSNDLKFGLKCPFHGSMPIWVAFGS